MSNPILDGIRTGASLVNQSEQLRQRKWESRVQADQFDRQLRLNRDKFDEVKRVQKRGEELELGRASYAKAYELNKQAREALDGSEEGKKRFEDLVDQRNAVISEAMQNNGEFRKWMDAVGTAAGSELPVSEASDGKGALNTVERVTAKQATRDVQGNEVQQGDPGNVFGGPGGMLAEGRQAGGMPQFISEYDMDAIFGSDSNDYWKSASVGLSLNDDRIEEQTARLGATDQAVTSAQSTYRESFGGLAGARNNLAAFDRQNTRSTGLSGGDNLPALEANPRAVREAEKAYADNVTIRNSLEYEDAPQQQSLGIPGGGSSILTSGPKVKRMTVAERSKNIQETGKAILDLVAVGSEKAPEAIAEHLEFLQNEHASLTEELKTGAYDDTPSLKNLFGALSTEDEKAAAYHDVLGAQIKAMQALQGGSQEDVPPKYSEKVVERIAGLPLAEQRKILTKELRVAEQAVKSAQDDMTKALLEQRRTNIEVFAKLGFSGNMAMANQIMNGYAPAHITRQQMFEQRMQQETAEGRQKIIKDTQDSAIKYLDKLVGGVEGKNRETSWQYAYRNGVLEHPLFRAGRISNSEVAALAEDYKQIAQFVPENRRFGLSLDIGSAVRAAKTAGLINSDMDGEDQYQAVDQLLEAAAAEANRSGGNLYDIINTAMDNGTIRALMSGR